MKLLDQTEVMLQYDDLLQHQPQIPTKPHTQRSTGCHLSDILKYLYFGSLPPTSDTKKKMQEAADDLQSAFDPTVIPLRMILGMAWEAWIVGMYPHLEWQPEELHRDGINGSPDGWSPGLDEFKLTWKSSRNRLGKAILQESLWMWQIKGYLAMDKSYQHIPMATLHVCFINGDYSHPYQPRYYKFTIEPEDEGELESFWQRAILPNKERAMVWKTQHEQRIGQS